MTMVEDTSPGSPDSRDAPQARPKGVLQVKGLTAGYGEADILHDINLDVAQGKVTTIIGPNGAGKSTLLKALMGYLIPRVGTVHFQDEDVTDVPVHVRVRKGIAFVPQLANVFPSLSVEENLRMGGYTLARDDVGARIAEQYARFPRLAERRRQRVRTMSGGERQMLALARALMTNPNMLLLDEPTAALSPRISAEVFEKILEINAQGPTVLIVEQNAELSLRNSAFGVVLANGRNVFDGLADGILHDEKIREAYLGVAE